MKKIAILLTAVALTACSTARTPQYGISASNNDALKTMRARSANVGAIEGLKNADIACRLGSPAITPPDQLTFEAYIQTALTQELKVAGLYDGSAPAVTLSGSVEQLALSTTQGFGFSSGSWDIGLHVNSSNGKSTYVSERTTFPSAWAGPLACERAAAAFLPAVQNLIGKLIKSPDFNMLIAPQPDLAGKK